MPIQCAFIYFCVANSGLRQMLNLGFPRRKLNPNKSEIPLDFGFAKNCRNLTTFRFRFDLRHIPTVNASCCSCPRCLVRQQCYSK